MAQLWGGRFTKETDKLVYNFNASISFDQKFYAQDIRGSIAHVTMLQKQGILTKEEKESIIEGLKGIQADVENGTLEITDEYEDIHSFVEANLIDRIGDAGKKLHTGRSRNDQVALDMRLYTRDEIEALDTLLKELLEVLLKLMKEHIETYMPGFTHLQKAQPVTLAHHLGAYFEMFKRDRLRMKDIRKRMNYCPLGAGALAGTTYPLDREYTAELLGFDGPTLNSMDSVSDRDYLIEMLSAMSTVMMHLSRFCEEVIIWNSNEYQFVEIDDAYSTGSSIMPQKKNPDIAELVRGKTGIRFQNKTHLQSASIEFQLPEFLFRMAEQKSKAAALQTQKLTLRSPDKTPVRAAPTFLHLPGSAPVFRPRNSVPQKWKTHFRNPAPAYMQMNQSSQLRQMPPLQSVRSCLPAPAPSKFPDS